MRLVLIVPLLLAVSASAQPAAPDKLLPPVTAPFIIHHVATGIGQGYSLVIADMNRDGKPDIAALGLIADAIYWYENPTWTPHLIITAKDAPKPVYMDAADIDGDGIPEIVLAFHFNTDPHKDTGQVAILHHDGDPTSTMSRPTTASASPTFPATASPRWSSPPSWRAAPPAFPIPTAT
jgi:hypothetical protein